MTKIQDKLKKAALCASVLSVCGIAIPTAFADEGTMDTIVGSIIDVIVDIFKYIGVVLLVWSVGMLVLAFKNEDADSKTRAIMLLIVSIVLIGIGAFLKPILEAAGISWSES